jgi:hypothetical protein
LVPATDGSKRQSQKTNFPTPICQKTTLCSWYFHSLGWMVWFQLRQHCGGIAGNGHLAGHAATTTTIAAIAGCFSFLLYRSPIIGILPVQ